MFKFIIFALILIFGIGFAMNWVNNHVPDQKTFSAGKIPDPELDGEYDGVAFLTGIWKGQFFDAKKNTGINIMRQNGKIVKQYPFTTYQDRDLQNPSLNVIRIDYNLPQNPFWLKLVEDEIVQVSDSEYIGKIYFNLLPSMPFSIIFYHLERAS